MYDVPSQEKIQFSCNHHRAHVSPFHAIPFPCCFFFQELKRIISKSLADWWCSRYKQLLDSLNCTKKTKQWRFAIKSNQIKSNHSKSQKDADHDGWIGTCNFKRLSWFSTDVDTRYECQSGPRPSDQNNRKHKTICEVSVSMFSMRLGRRWNSCRWIFLFRLLLLLQTPLTLKLFNPLLHIRLHDNLERIPSEWPKLVQWVFFVVGWPFETRFWIIWHQHWVSDSLSDSHGSILTIAITMIFTVGLASGLGLGIIVKLILMPLLKRNRDSVAPFYWIWFPDITCFPNELTYV